MNTNPERREPSFAEFVALMAVLTSLVALSIDAMLPALPAIGQDLGVIVANNNQYVISAFFLGFATGQLIYGPISDSIGRKPVVYAGLALFIVGCLISVMATDYTTMLVGRVLQGIGVAGPRTVTIAMIRDKFEGREMARVMSFVMAIFIIVPAVAPSLGQGVLWISGWRAIFGLFLGLAAIGFIWLAIRQPETLAVENRARLSLRHTLGAMAETLRNRVSFAYIIAGGLVFGAFVGYLISAQQIFDKVYGVGDYFPALFALLAVNLGFSSIANAKLVMRFGMQTLSSRAINLVTAFAVIFFIIALSFDGQPPLWMFVVYAMATFSCIGILFGNLVAMAMEPLGHIAGTASSVIGASTTFISLIIGGSIGLAFDGTVLPLVGGFALLSGGAFIVMLWGGRQPGN